MTDAEKESLLLEARIEGDSRYTLRTSAMAFAKGAEFALNLLRSDLMANGLTEAETNATPSVAGLTVRPWIKWGGGSIPVLTTTEVAIILRDGCEVIHEAGRFYWHHDNVDCDIVAYRIL